MNETHTISSRAVAFLALRRIEREDAYANIALKQLLNKYHLPVEEAKLAAQITYGATRMRLSLDHMLSQFLKNPLAQLMPEIKIILRLSLYQLHYLQIPEYAAVDEGVRLAKKYASPRLSGLVNGVLRQYLRSDREQLLPKKEDGIEDYLSTTLSFPRWLTSYLLQHYTNDEAEQFCLHANAHQGIAIRTNTLKTTREQLIADLAAEDIIAEAAGFAPETLQLSGKLGNMAAHPLFKKGHFVAQGLSSQLAAHVLSPKPGSKVLDLCAAPGGKTAHLAALMNNQGEIHAFDIHPHKVELIKDNARRLGIGIIKADTADSRALPQSYLQWADYILLDAPCSGLGVLGMRPDSRFRKETAAITELAKLSYELLSAAADYLKPGGRICYATCTITEEENSANIKRFLAWHPEFSLQSISGLMEYMPEMKKELSCGAIQLLPFTTGGRAEGFYLALLEKAK